jgi:hypothetical protein
MARRALLGIGVLALAVALPVPAALADPIVITGGSMVAAQTSSGVLGTVDVEGTRGFELGLILGLSGTTGPWQCRPCGPPGTAIDLGGWFSASDGFGAVKLGGASYAVPSNQAYAQLRPLGGPVIVPPLGASAALSAPFELDTFGTSLVDLYDFGGEPTLRFLLFGRGTATLLLEPDRSGALAWNFARVTYEFSPVPEPSSLLLLGAGLLTLAVRRHRRR